MASFRSRVIAWACSLSSSMQPTTSAAPYRLASGTTRWKRSSPSSRFTLLISDLPGVSLSASSITAASVESMTMGALIFLVNAARKAVTSSVSSRSGSWRQTSSRCAPPRT